MPRTIERRIQVAVTTGDGAIRVRASRKIPPGPKFKAFANGLEEAATRVLGLDASRTGRAWIIEGTAALATFQSFVNTVEMLCDNNGLEMLPIRWDDISDDVVLPAPGVTRASGGRKRKPIEDSEAQIWGELNRGRITVPQAVAKLGAAYARRGIEMDAEVFKRVLAIFKKATPTASAG
jgi:hypothetical protein